MRFLLIFTLQYEKCAARFFKRYPELEKPYLKTRQLPELNSHHPLLRLHALSGNCKNCTRSPKSVFPHYAGIAVNDEEIIPVNVGDHDAVY